MLNRNGHEIVVETLGQVDADGRRARNGSAQDVTERVEAERAVRHAEELFRRAFDDAPVGVSLIAPDGTWLRVNRAYREMFGYSEAEFESTTIRDITIPEDNPTDDAFMAVARRGEVDHTTVAKRYRHRDGHEIKVRAHVSLIRDEQERPSYFIAQLENTSEHEARAGRARAACRPGRGVGGLDSLDRRRGSGHQLEPGGRAALRPDRGGGHRLAARGATRRRRDQLRALGSRLVERATREEFPWVDPSGTRREPRSWHRPSKAREATPWAWLRPPRHLVKGREREGTPAPGEQAAPGRQAGDHGSPGRRGRPRLQQPALGDPVLRRPHPARWTTPGSNSADIEESAAPPGAPPADQPPTPARPAGAGRAAGLRAGRTASSGSSGRVIGEDVTLSTGLAPPTSGCDSTRASSTRSS